MHLDPYRASENKAMSITGASDLNKTFKKPSHWRNDSGELDVFEAARYFSAATEVSGGHNGSPFAQKLRREERQQGWRSGGRISLDFPMRSSIPSQAQAMEKQVLKEKKKYKQPSSPGGRLASFLNSLFHQIPSKKKKSKSTTTTQSVKDEDESPGGGRRKRRISISHFRSGSSNTAEYSKSIYSSSMSSGFRTPPTKFYKDLRSYSDHKPVAPSLVKYDHEKFKLTSGSAERFKSSGATVISERERSWADDGDSDSSSDLFELENCDLGYYPSGLPVYETTDIDTIKRGVPISNGA